MTYTSGWPSRVEVNAMWEPSGENAGSVAVAVLSTAHDTPVAGPITAPASSAKLARSGTRRASGTPSRAADNLRPAAITRIGQTTRSPRPGPFTASVVLPALLPVRTPVA